jgi:hypothetical protein
MTGVMHECRVLGVRYRANTDCEIVHVSPVHGPLVIFAVFGAHDEFARADARHLEQRLVSHFLWVECIHHS